MYLCFFQKFSVIVRKSGAKEENRATEKGEKKQESLAQLWKG